VRFCVFCGSRPGNDPAVADLAKSLAHVLVGRGHGVVFGGGSVGLMGVLADEVLAAGGEVIGVMPKHMVDREVAHAGTQLHIVDTMHTRKALMYDLSDAVIALPGGYGTLDELFEVLTWNQLGLHAKPAGLLDHNGYFAPLVTFLDGAVDAGFIRAEHRTLLLEDSDPERLLDALENWRPTATSKWITAEDR
jgi:uncharacterized protein (TIGR00730 family)